MIPSIQDYLENMVVTDWMNNGKGVPSRDTLQFKNRAEIEKYINRENIDIIKD